MNISVLRLAFLSLTCILSVGLYAQNSLKDIVKQGDAFYERGMYRSAIDYYQRLESMGQASLIDNERLGIAHLESGNLEAAKRAMVRRLNIDKDKEAFYYLGRIEHLQGNYTKALSYYKRFLVDKGRGHDLSNAAIEHAKRCGTGLRLLHADEMAYVENLGRSVNTSWDERAPIESPGYTERIYFSSDRAGATGGARDSKGAVDLQYGTHRYDMYGAEYSQGVWSSAAPINDRLNTALNEYILGFQDGGNLLHFLRWDGNRFNIYVDTFSVDQENLTGFWDRDFGIEADGGASLWNDTTLLFSSRFYKKGQADYDLYISKFRAGRWTEPQSISATINTPYNQISPWMAPDGRTIYFSSDAPQSIGGYDIFYVRYDDRTGRWSAAEQMRSPINTAADERDFSLSKDGLRGWLISNRGGGQGGYDIYSAYFKEALTAHMQPSHPISFDLAATVLDTLRSGAPVFADGERREIDIADIYYDASDYFLTSENKGHIDEYVNLLKSYPQIEIYLTAHGDGKDPVEFDHYFTIKRAEKVADYLVSQGVPASRIHVRGAGSQFPISVASDSDASSRTARYNRRILVDLQGTEALPIRKNYLDARIPDNLRMPQAARFKDQQKGLSYRILLTETSQPLRNQSFISNPDAMIEKRYGASLYSYLIGYYRDYYAASRELARMQASGMHQARIVPYIDGRSPSRLEIMDAQEKYRDLRYYIANEYN